MKKLFVLFVFILCAGFSYTQNANDVLNKLQQKFNTITDLSADFKQTASSTDTKGGLSGRFFFKKKDMFRIELKTLIITGDGKSTWNYSIKAKKYIVNNYDPNDPTNLSLTRFVYDYPSKCKVSIAGSDGDCTIIELQPKKSDLNFKKAKLWKDGQDLIKKIQFEDQNGIIVTVELSNIKLNQKLPDSKFSMTPPEGSKIIDLR